MTILNTSQVSGTLAGLVNLSKKGILDDNVLQEHLAKCIQSLDSHTKCLISVHCDLLIDRNRINTEKLDALKALI